MTASHALRARVAYAASALLFFAGCTAATSVVRAPDEVLGYAPLQTASSLLLGADEEEDEFIGLLTQPEPEAASAAEALAVLTAKSSAFGVRAGVLSPMAAEQGTWSSGMRAGFYFRGGSAKKFEIGFDYASIEADYDRGATVTSTIITARFDILFGSWQRAEPGTVLYLLGGGEVGTETGSWEATGDTLDAMGGGGNVGFGVGSSKGTWDMRAVYSILAGDNASALMSISLGYGF